MKEQKIYYCPICGSISYKGNRVCEYCNARVKPAESIYDESYYREKAVERWGYPHKWVSILNEEEISQNPKLNHDLYNSKEMEIERFRVELRQRGAIDEPGFQYCPYCGLIVPNGTDKCPACKHDIKPVRCMIDTFDFGKQSLDSFGNCNKWHDIFVEKYASKNPEYSEDIANNKDVSPLLDWQISHYAITFEKLAKFMREKEEKEKHTPRCPICGSTNIHKISAGRKLAGAAAFGIFSKTARSQWICDSCHSKF